MHFLWEYMWLLHSWLFYSPHWRVAHTRFVVDSVREKYKQMLQTTLQVYHNTVSTRHTLGAINHDTERISCYQPLNGKYAIRGWCYQPWHGKHFGAINCNTESMRYVLGAINHYTESMWYMLGAINHDTESTLVLSTPQDWCYQS